MTAYKQVPLEPTPEMMLAAGDAVELFVHEMKKAGGVVEPTDYALRAVIYRTMLAAAPEPPAESAWRTIESAPHGQRVLLGWYDWRDGTWCMEVGCASHGRRTDAGSSVSHHGSATHWQPLPAPPALSNKGG